jgi:dihydrofolate reductase
VALWAKIIARREMRRLIVSNVMSLDGFFEGPNKDLSWHLVDDEFFAYAGEMLRSVDTILFGRTTYELMAKYWPSAPKDEIADKMNSLDKIVFSKTLGTAEWRNSRLVQSDAAGEVEKLKQQSGKDMVILGSGMLASDLLARGLIDEYRIILNPVFVGAGTPLFKGIDHGLTLKLRETRVLHSGVVILYYQKE